MFNYQYKSINNWHFVESFGLLLSKTETEKVWRSTRFWGSDFQLHLCYSFLRRHDGGITMTLQKIQKELFLNRIERIWAGGCVWWLQVGVQKSNRRLLLEFSFFVALSLIYSWGTVSTDVEGWRLQSKLWNLQYYSWRGDFARENLEAKFVGHVFGDILDKNG